MYRDYEPPGAPGEVTDLVELYRPSPNPFASTTRIAYVVRSGGEQVDIGIYDVSGRRLRALVNGFQATGRYEVIWDGTTDAGYHADPGVYFVRSGMAGRQQAMRVVFLK